MESNYLILIVAFTFCLLIRTGYELLKEVGKVNQESKLIVGVIFATMIVLWVCWFALCPFDPFRLHLPNVVQYGGFVLFVVGMILAIGALLQLRGVENIDHLVTTGLFAKLRHPMYTGFIFWILGWSTYCSAIASLAVGLIGIANILYWRRLEEARLLERYGDLYQQYRLTTWF